MDTPEYLMLFSDQGEFTVEVKFERERNEPGSRSVPNRRATMAEITELLERITTNPPRIAIDEYPCLIRDIQIDPHSKKVRLNVHITRGLDD